MNLPENQELIKKLDLEQQALIARLKAIRNAIVGFGGELSNKELEELLNVEGEIPLSKMIVAPAEFRKDLPRTQKIAYALKQLGGEGNVSEITEMLLSLESQTMGGEELAKFRRNITLLTSYLYRDGRLAVKREGKDGRIRYRYRLME